MIVNKNFSELRVLVIDDDKVFLALLEMMLNSAGITQITCAETAAVAHEKIRSVAKPFDCVICDFIMPEATGLEFLKVIRRGQIKQLGPHTAFIICTANDDPAVAECAAALDVTAYVKKPPTQEILLAALERGIRHRRSQNAQKYEDVSLPSKS